MNSVIFIVIFFCIGNVWLLRNVFLVIIFWNYSVIVEVVVINLIVIRIILEFFRGFVYLLK